MLCTTATNTSNTIRTRACSTYYADSANNYTAQMGLSLALSSKAFSVSAPVWKLLHDNSKLVEPVRVLNHALKCERFYV